MSRFEKEYKALLRSTIRKHEIKTNRTGVYTFYNFGQTLNIDLDLGFPILTSKKIFFDKALAEYNWMMQGLTTTKYLNDHGVHWWDEYAIRGNLGKTYGYQLRNFNGEFDQMEHVHKELRMNSRRAHATFWNPTEINQTALPHCITGITFSRSGNKLNMSMQLRSSDLFLGLPYDIIVAAMFLIETAKFNDLKPKYLSMQLTDAHVYENHISQVGLYCGRKMKKLPILYTDENGLYKLMDYEHGPLIEAKMNN